MRRVEGRTRGGDGDGEHSSSPGSDSARRLRGCFGPAGAASVDGAAAVRFNALKHGSHTCPGACRCSGRLQRLNRLPHSSQSCSPLEARRGVTPADPSGKPAQEYAGDTGAHTRVSADVCFDLLRDISPSLLTCICSGSSICLWKSDQRSGGSSSGVLHTRIVGSTVLELHAGGVVVGWRWCLRHGASSGMCVCRTAQRRGCRSHTRLNRPLCRMPLSLSTSVISSSEH